MRQIARRSHHSCHPPLRTLRYHSPTQTPPPRVDTDPPNPPYWNSSSSRRRPNVDRSFHLPHDHRPTHPNPSRRTQPRLRCPHRGRQTRSLHLPPRQRLGRRLRHHDRPGARCETPSSCQEMRLRRRYPVRPPHLRRRIGLHPLRPTTLQPHALRRHNHRPSRPRAHPRRRIPAHPRSGHRLHRLSPRRRRYPSTTCDKHYLPRTPPHPHRLCARNGPGSRPLRRLDRCVCRPLLPHATPPHPLPPGTLDHRSRLIPFHHHYLATSPSAATDATPE